jgi:hypothetical protein
MPGILLLVSDYYVPRPNFPSFHKAIADVWIIADKFSGGCFVTAAENEQSSIWRVSQCPGKNQLASRMSFSCKA